MHSAARQAGKQAVYACYGLEKRAAGIVPYDPLIAAARDVTHVKPFPAHTLREMTAPLRASLVRGIPSMLGGAYVGAEVSDKKHRGSGALGGAGVGYLLGGFPAYLRRQELGQRMQEALISQRRLLNDADIAMTGPAWEQVLEKAKGVAGRTYSGYTLHDLYPALKGLAEGKALHGIPKAQRQAARIAERDLQTAVRQGLRPDSFAEAAGKDTPLGREASALLQRIFRNDPALTPRQVRARLHPDVIHRIPEIDPAVAAEAFQQLGTLPPSARAAPEFAPIVDFGKHVKAERDKAMKGIEDLREYAFPERYYTDRQADLARWM